LFLSFQNRDVWFAGMQLSRKPTLLAADNHPGVGNYLR
jgi:hypothetical protein